MKDNLKDLKKLLEGVQLGNRVSLFFVLLIVYYIVNLFTSDINTGMSGGLEAEHNIYNQILASLLAVYVLYHSINTPSKQSYFFLVIAAAFLVYMAIRIYFGYINPTSNKGASYFSGYFKIAYWLGGTIFCVKCFRYSKIEDIERFIKVAIWVYLIFATYRLFTQKALLGRLGISAGVNSVGQAYMSAPLILLVFKDKMKVFLFFYVAFICIYSAKRQTAIGMGIVSVFAARDLYYSYFKKRKLLAWLVLLVAVYFGGDLMIRSADDLIRRQTRTEERGDMDSGRLVLWQTALDGFERASYSEKVFGGGPGTGRRYIGEFFPIARLPHNSFIQILCDYGYIGLFLYVLFILALLAYIVNIRSLEDKLVYSSICLCWIFHSVISHPGNLRFIFLAIGVGYIIYKQELNNARDTLDQRSTSYIA